MFHLERETIESVRLNAQGELEVIRRNPSNTWLCATSSSWVPAFTERTPDQVTKDVYGVVDGKIQKIREVHGRHIPAQNIPERFEFPDESAA